MDEITQKSNEEEQKKKLPLFSCTKISKFYLVPLMIPIFCIAYNFSIKKFRDINPEFDKIKYHLTKILFITRILGGSLYFVFKNAQKQNQQKSLKEKNSLKLIFNDIEKIKFIKALKIISILSIFELFIIELDFLTTSERIDFNFRLFYLLFVVLLSIKIFGTVIFIHQIISLLFSILGLIVVLIPYFIKFDDLISNWLIILLGIASSVFYALTLLGQKYLMEELFISPLLLLFLTGLINFFADFIFNICYNLIIGENLKNIFTDLPLLIYEENKTECVIYLIVIIFIGTIYFILVKLALYLFSPTLLVVTDLVSPIADLFLDINQIDLHFVLSIVGYTISLIASIFYNELIVCNFLGLNENIAENIKKRSQSENSKILLDENKSLDVSYCSENEEGKEKNDENEAVNQ